MDLSRKISRHFFRLLGVEAYNEAWFEKLEAVFEAFHKRGGALTRHFLILLECPKNEHKYLIFFLTRKGRDIYFLKLEGKEAEVNLTRFDLL